MKYEALWNRGLRALLMLTAALFALGFSEKTFAETKARNVIVFIADGCSNEQYTLVRWYKGAPLSFDFCRVGAIKTHIADSVVADSAPAATAFASGARTSDKHIGVGPHERTISTIPAPPPSLQYRPLATVLEGAKLLKKSTGIVATSRVTHATPAAYVAHVPDRNREDDIMEQLVYQGVDIVLGGGKRHLLPAATEGKRADGEDLMKVLYAKGYEVVEDRYALWNARSQKIFGVFAASHMAAEIDRSREHRYQPSLREMTEKAIERLSKDPDGFFLMVEGSQVDWACHANDPAHLCSDLLAFDSAVEAGLEFAKREGETLVLIVSDHNTGGFSIGNYTTSQSYSGMKVEALLDPIRKMQFSAGDLWTRLGKDRGQARLKEVVRQGWGIEMSDGEARRILSLSEQYAKQSKVPFYALGEVLCPVYTYCGWTSHGHTGGDVPLHAYGPGSPRGVLDAPEIGLLCARAMGVDLEKLNERLFVEAGNAFGRKNVVVDNRDKDNPIVTVSLEGKTYRLPVNKNLLLSRGSERSLEGVVVYAPHTGRAYIPMEAVLAIKGENTPLPSVSP